MAARDIDALTTSLDLHATLMEIFNLPDRHTLHGRSFLPLVHKEVRSVRDYLLCGVWGRQVQLVDPQRMYSRAPVGSHFPLALWSKRWSTMPRPGHPCHRLPRPDRRAHLAFMPGSDVPEIRQPFQPGDPLPFHAYDAEIGRHRLFDLQEDPSEDHDLAGSSAESGATELLRVALEAVNAPGEQFERLGLA